MAQYYTLEEAARVLQLSQDEVKKMAEEKKVRSFRDRGTLRFRAQDIDELARNLGLGSDPDLQLGEVPPPKKTSSPTPGKKPKGEDDVFDFKLGVDDDQVEIGQEMKPPAGGSKGGGSSAGRGRTPGPKSPSPRSPAPKPGSDSDVRLVPDSSSEMSPVRPDDSKSGPSSGKGKRPSKLAAPDSGVRIVPLDSDSDVKMELDSSDENVSLGGGKPKSASDSDIRIEHSKRSGRGDAGPVTEEIDLDAEMSKQGPSSGSTRKPTAKGDSSSGSHAPLPTASPFELSDADLELEPKSKKGSKATQHKAPTDSSDDFRLSSGEQSPLELGSDEMAAADEEVRLGELNAGAGHSGINLKDPADSGISLEQEGSDELEVPLDAGATPRPARGKAKKEDSDSEFELSLDDSSDDTSGDSSFELSLEGAESSVEMEAVSSGADSDSEFELTLDDSGASSPLEASGERDIFETDFEVPALDEESGSAVAALDEDTDLESSDFDLALSDEDMVQSDDESGSQVVTLDEEADDAAATVQRKPKTKVSKLAKGDEDDEDDSPWSGVTDEDEDAETVPGKVRVEYRDTPATPWGVMPALLMIPCVLVLFVVGLMGFEVIQGMVGYRKGGKATGLVVRPLTEAITGEALPGSPAKK